MRRGETPVTDTIMLYRHRRSKQAEIREVLTPEAIERLWDYFLDGCLFENLSYLTMPQAVSLMEDLNSGSFLIIKSDQDYDQVHHKKHRKQQFASP